MQKERIKADVFVEPSKLNIHYMVVYNSGRLDSLTQIVPFSVFCSQHQPTLISTRSFVMIQSSHKQREFLTSYVQTMLDKLSCYNSDLH